MVDLKGFTDPKRNGLGWIIAFFFFLLILYYNSSLSGLSPITNSTIANQLGCNTCGPGGTAGGAYNLIKPLAPVFFLSIPAIIGIGLIDAVRRGKIGKTEPAEMPGEEEE